MKIFNLNMVFYIFLKIYQKNFPGKSSILSKNVYQTLSINLGMFFMSKNLNVLFSLKIFYMTHSDFRASLVVHSCNPTNLGGRGQESGKFKASVG